jgi:hypothetical protein
MCVLNNGSPTSGERFKRCRPISGARFSSANTHKMQVSPAFACPSAPLNLGALGSDQRASRLFCDANDVGRSSDLANRGWRPARHAGAVCAAPCSRVSVRAHVIGGRIMRAQRTALICLIAAMAALSTGAHAQKMFSRGPSPDVGRPGRRRWRLSRPRLGRGRPRDHHGSPTRL